MVHRLLAVAIGADSTYPELLDKRKTHELCHNLNYRNRMAQYAGRASVALHTHVSICLFYYVTVYEFINNEKFSCFLQMFFRDRVQDEEGYVLYVRKNALQILIPRYGLEGTLYVSGRKELDEIGFIYNEEVPYKIQFFGYCVGKELIQRESCKVQFKSIDPLFHKSRICRVNEEHSWRHCDC